MIHLNYEVAHRWVEAYWMHGAAGLSLILFVILFKRKQVKDINLRTKTLIHSKNRKLTHGLFNELGISSSALASMSLLDIYSAQENHKEFIDTIGERFPHVMGDAATLDWLEKVKELEKGGMRSLGSYQNAYVGEQGELDAMAKLEELGFTDVKQFESKTHANNDLHALDPDGNKIEFSVKSYDDFGDLKKVISEHPDSNHYIVNSEVYEKLENSGELLKYKSQGIEIMDGGFSHVEHVEEARNALESISESMDFGDDISVLAIAFFGVKTVKNVMHVAKGQQSSRELGINVAGDAVGIGVRAAGAGVGAELGAAIGTAFMPGIGTIVGGGLGAISGIVIASDFVEDTKEKFKWGDILKAIEHFGGSYEEFFKNPDLRKYRKQKSLFLDHYKNDICNYSKTKAILHSERNEFLNSTSLMTRLGFVPMTLNQTLINEYIVSLKHYIKSVHKSSNKVVTDIYEMSISMTKNIDEEKRDKVRKRILGELVVENRDLFLLNLSGKERKMLERYDSQVEKNPNHPYKLPGDKLEIIKNVAWKEIKRSA